MLPLPDMRIAVDARFLQAEDKPELRDFTKEVFVRLSAQHKEHDFIFFTDSGSNGAVRLPKNVATVTITPKPTNVFLYEWWYNTKLALAIKKCTADLFIATYGLGSLTISIPQVLILRDLAFLHTRAYFPENSYSFYRRSTSRFIKRSTAIVTLSNFIKEELSKHYKVNEQIIQVIGSGTDTSFKPIKWEEREAIKEQFAEGWEYFVFTGGLHPPANLLNVLKAFSIFKKWQKTNMKLVVTGTFGPAFEKFLEKLDSYKYRNEVFIKKDVSQVELSQIVAASYAMIFPSSYEGFAVPVLNALQCHVPVITSKNGSMSEIAGDAALYVDPSSPEEIAEQMKKIYKDENLRNRMIAEGRLKSELYTWDNTAALLWQVIQQAYSR
jgi:glycosyltransferase involved in cell wall biosynthesis